MPRKNEKRAHAEAVPEQEQAPAEVSSCGAAEPALTLSLSVCVSRTKAALLKGRLSSYIRDPATSTSGLPPIALHRPYRTS